MDDETDAVYRFGPGSVWAAYAILSTLLAWLISVGAVFLHTTGVAAPMVDMIALVVSGIAATSWLVAFKRA